MAANARRNNALEPVQTLVGSDRRVTDAPHAVELRFCKAEAGALLHHFAADRQPALATSAHLDGPRVAAAWCEIARRAKSPQLV
ncbi:hypothetical protein Amsp01_056340 [Amycolatopsis sp. NBRC 101858]|nr:hypothetical protein Amsp01_056340 [Amycolatopsis sp. NBRC 101858]